MRMASLLPRPAAAARRPLSSPLLQPGGGGRGLVMQLLAHFAPMVAASRRRFGGSCWACGRCRRLSGARRRGVVHGSSPCRSQHLAKSNRPGHLAKIPGAQLRLTLGLPVDQGGQTLFVVDVGELKRGG